MNSFVFCRDPEFPPFYDAFIPGILNVRVMTDIVYREGKGWGWNCYDIGWFQSRNELVRHYLSVKGSIRDYVLNRMNQEVSK